MMKTKLKFAIIPMVMILCLSLINVSAATISKTKIKSNKTSYGNVNVSDKAYKNNVTGGWTFDSWASGNITSGFGCRAYASKLNNPVLTNNGNTAKHDVVWTVYRTSSGQDTGSGGMNSFTFTYNPSTKTIS